MSQPWAISPIGPRPIGKGSASLAGQRSPVGPLFRVFKEWCHEGSPLTARARHVLVQIAKRMAADDDGRQVAFVGEERLAGETGLSQRSVRRAVQELRDAGALKTHLGGVTRGHPHQCNEFGAHSLEVCLES